MRGLRARPVALVAGRELRQRVRSRTFRMTTAVLVVAALAAVVLPAVLGGGDEGPVRVSLAPAAADLRAPLEGGTGERDEVVDVADPASVRAAAGDGDVDAGVLATEPAVTVVARDDLRPEVRALLLRAAAEARLRGALSDAGADPGVADAALAPPRPEVAFAGDAVPQDATAAALLTAVALVLVLVFSGSLVAAGVAEEKATRISEILLAAVRPGELLAGKVVGVGLLALAQLAAVLVPAAAAVLAIGTVDLPDAAPSAVGAGLLWFAIGYVTYSVAFGALGALEARQQEVTMATAPVSYLMWGSYFIVVFGIEQIDAGWFRVLSLLPLLSPMLMPARIVTGSVGAAEVALALVIAVATAAALVWIGGRVYRAGLTASGPQVSVVAALRRAVGRS